LPALEDAEDLLVSYLELYWEGLTRPLRFFPEASWAYAREILEGKGSAAQGLKKARDLWEGSRYSRGEREDPYWDLCFRGCEPLDQVFCELAERVYRPFFHRVETIA
jgi:exodeoxyribonuclease V gamma subunit